MHRAPKLTQGGPNQPMKTHCNRLHLVVCVVALLLARSAASGAFFATNTTINAGETSYDGQDIIVFDCTLTVNGQHTFSDVLLIGGTLTHSPATNGTGGLSLIVSNNIVIDAASSIRADGLGYAGGAGPGAGASIYSDIPYGPPFYYT